MPFGTLRIAKPLAHRLKKTVQSNKNIPYYLTAVGLFILLKFGFTLAENTDLTFLIKPTDKLIGLLTGSKSVFISDSGYFYKHLNIIIDKSCSGFNFWILCFLLFTFLTLKYFDKTLNKILTIPAALVGAYILTIFVNTSRIFASIVVQTQTKDILLNQQHILHEAIGIITNLTFLILAYVLIEKLLIHKRNNAKLA
ncbi:MAG: exosortase K [Flavobacteriales bacterium]|nr:exosortase K [Flavobacteriales bacterium]